MTACVAAVIALGMLRSLPGAARVAPSGGEGRMGLAGILHPYRILLANPQSWLCAICSGCPFVPTTIGALIWRVPFYTSGLDIDYQRAILSASMVPLGWVLGAPLLGWISDRIGRRRPVVIVGGLVLVIAEALVLFAPAPIPTHWAVDLVFGIASGAAMPPYSVIKEINPDSVKGSATGTMNLIVFAISAIVGTAHIWILAPGTTGSGGGHSAGRSVGTGWDHCRDPHRISAPRDGIVRQDACSGLAGLPVPASGQQVGTDCCRPASCHASPRGGHTGW